MKIFLLICLLLPLSLISQLDSMEYQGSWYKIYPIEAEAEPSLNLLRKLDLDKNEYSVWLDWKRNKDPRLNQKSKFVRDAIRKELIDKLLISKDYYEVKKKYKNSNFYGCGYSRKRKFRRFFKRFFCSIGEKLNQAKKAEAFQYLTDNQVELLTQSSVSHLPDGKYIQLFNPLVSRNHFSKSEITSQPIASIFELKNDLLEGEFIQLNSMGDTLFKGVFKNGLKEGVWNKKVFYYDLKYGNKNQKFLSSKNSEMYIYSNGVLNGDYKYYSNDKLEVLGKFENGYKAGVWTILKRNDSIVFDAFDMKKNVRVLNQRHDDFARGYIYKFNHKKYLKDEYRGYLPVNYEYLVSLSNYGKSNEQTNIVYDSLILSVKNDYNFKIPCYNSFYKHYYKNKLFADLSWKETEIESLDTVVHSFEITGSTYYVNGNLKSKYKQDPNDPNRYYYTNDGRLYKTNNTLSEEFNKQEKVKFDKISKIDGFEVFQRTNSEKEFSLLNNPIEKGDTIFLDITWDKKKQLLFKKYTLINSPYEIKEYYISFEDCRRFIYIDSTNSLFKKEFQFKDVIIEIEYKNKIQTALKFLDKNRLPYNGYVKITTGTKEFSSLIKNDMLQINLSNENCLFYPQNQYELESMNSFKSLKATIKDGYLDGLAQFDYGKQFPVSTLNYSAGKINGNLKVVVNEKDLDDEYSYYFLRPNWIYYRRFKRHTFSKDFIYKEYNFMDGKLDGLYRKYSSFGDTLAVYNYKNGSLIGKQFLKSPKYTVELNYGAKGLDGSLKITNNTLNKNSIEPNSVLFDAVFSNGQLLRYNRELSLQRNLVTNEFEDQFETCEWVSDSYITTIINDNKDTIQQFVLKPGSYFNQINYRENSKNEALKFDSTSFYMQLFDGRKVLLYEDECIFYFEDYLSREYRRGKASIFDYFNSYHWSVNLENPSNHIYTKFYPNNKIARSGHFFTESRYDLNDFNIKTGTWKFNYYSGIKNLEIDYFPISQSKCDYAQFDKVQLGTVRFYDSLNRVAATANLYNEYEFYNCSADNYSASREYKSIVDLNPTDGRDYANGKQVFYFDNGMKMSEGQTINGMPEGIWKFYTPDGKLYRIGKYVNGIKSGRWLEGDLSGIAYIEDVCLKEDNPEINYQIAELQRDKEIIVMVYLNGDLKIQQTSSK